MKLTTRNSAVKERKSRKYKLDDSKLLSLTFGLTVKRVGSCWEAKDREK
jgi:hypothetical protein